MPSSAAAPEAVDPVDVVAAVRASAERWCRDGHTADDLRRCDTLPDLFVSVVEALQQHVGPPDRRRGFVKYTGLLSSVLPPDHTPPRWGEPQSQPVAVFDVVLTLVATAIGTPFGWEGQQAGRLVHDIVPTAGSETMQVGASSSVPLAWHTEDSFHPDRADVILLACLRNPDAVGSRAANVRDLGLSATDLEILRRPAVTIAPDDSYAPSDDAGAVGMATIWDAPDGVCLRFDPAYTDFLTDDAEFRAAYDALAAALGERSDSIPLRPGDVLVIDNDLVVHARDPFQARYDGTDRWLKRVLVHLDRPRPEAERDSGAFGQVLLPGPAAPGADGRG